VRVAECWGGGCEFRVDSCKLKVEPRKRVSPTGSESATARAGESSRMRSTEVLLLGIFQGDREKHSQACKEDGEINSPLRDRAGRGKFMGGRIGHKSSQNAALCENGRVRKSYG
jgi:hypothetical protein